MMSRWDYIPGASYAASCHSQPLVGGGDRRTGTTTLRSQRDAGPGEASSLQRNNPKIDNVTGAPNRAPRIAHKER